MAKSPKRKPKPRAAASKPARKLPTGTLAFAAIGLVGAALAAFVAHRDAANTAPATRAVALTIPTPPEPPKAPPPAPAVAEVEPTPAAPPRMSATQSAAFDAWLLDAYRKCWTAPAVAADSEPYIPKVRIALKSDGTLETAPRLVNPPSDPATRPQADALKAVKSCDPLRVPDKYAAYYPQWKTKTVYFAP